MDEWYEDGNSVERFISPLRNLYKGTGHHGFSVWGHSRSKCNNNGTKGCTAIEMRGIHQYINYINIFLISM